MGRQTRILCIRHRIHEPIFLVCAVCSRRTESLNGPRFPPRGCPIMVSNPLWPDIVVRSHVLVATGPVAVGVAEQPSCCVLRGK